MEKVVLRKPAEDICMLSNTGFGYWTSDARLILSNIAVCYGCARLEEQGSTRQRVGRASADLLIKLLSSSSSSSRKIAEKKASPCNANVRPFR